MLVEECRRDLENPKALAYLEIQLQKYKYSLHFDLNEQLISEG